MRSHVTPKPVKWKGGTANMEGQRSWVEHGAIWAFKSSHSHVCSLHFHFLSLICHSVVTIFNFWWVVTRNLAMSKDVQSFSWTPRCLQQAAKTADIFVPTD